MEIKLQDEWESIGGAVGRGHSPSTATLDVIPYHAEEAPWYAVQTRYRFERKVAATCALKGIETFLPLLEESHRWSDRQKSVAVPLFSGYVFVRISELSRTEVLRTTGVIGFVCFQGDEVPIPRKQIDYLRKLLSQKVPFSLHAFLHVGQKVRVRGGCLDGLEGILEENGRKQMIVSVECIRQSLAIKIQGYELELI